MRNKNFFILPNRIFSLGLKPKEFAVYCCRTAESSSGNGEAEAERFYKAAEREKQQLEKLIKELDNIIRCLYKDRVCGRITSELLRVFIRKIEVFEKMEKYSRKVGNLINIHYVFQLPEQDGMPMLKMLLPSNMRETA